MKTPFDPVRNPMAPAPVDPPRDQPTDAALHAAIVRVLAAEGRLAGESFGLSVSGGTVTLGGAVSREYLRGLVDACVSGVPGVLVVENRLAVRERGPG